MSDLALPRNPSVGGPLACIDGGAGIAYLNQPASYAAFHVAPLDWAACTANTSFQYTRTMPDERIDIYPAIIKAGLRVLIYNGEADACVSALPAVASTVRHRSHCVRHGRIPTSLLPHIVPPPPMLTSRPLRAPAGALHRQ